MERALSVSELLNKKYKLFDFQGEWKDAFDCPERYGVWFIWGNSGNGKTTFVLELVKYLATFVKVAYNSLEEGAAHTMQKSFRNVGMSEVAKRVMLIQGESIEDTIQRMLKKKSPDVIVIDSFQYAQLSYKSYLEMKKKLQKKLIILISHAEGKQPAGRAARSVMFDATLKIYIEGYKAISKGRYIGSTGEYVIWPEGVIKYYGSIKNNPSNQ